MKSQYFIIPVLIISLWNPVKGQNFLFYKERIEIEITESFSKVTGIYYFKNSGVLPADRTIFYPFSTSYNLSDASGIKVYDLSSDKKLPFESHNKGIIFRLKIPANSQRFIKVEYSQNSPDNVMEYILKTTKYWKNPLEKAEYIIKLNRKFNLINLSLKYDYKDCTKDYMVFYITRTNYMPKNNLVIQWGDEK